MKSLYRRCCFLVLTAAFLVPGTIAPNIAWGQDENRQRDEHRNENEKPKRVYDRSRKDYHNWDDKEDHAYRQYLTEQHKDYRDYSKLTRKEQDQYWNWRHDHSDDK